MKGSSQESLDCNIKKRTKTVFYSCHLPHLYEIFSCSSVSAAVPLPFVSPSKLLKAISEGQNMEIVEDL